MDERPLESLSASHHRELCLPEIQTCTFHYMAVDNLTINDASWGTIESTDICVVEFLNGFELEGAVDRAYMTHLSPYIAMSNRL